MMRTVFSTVTQQIAGLLGHPPCQRGGFRVQSWDLLPWNCLRWNKDCAPGRCRVDNCLAKVVQLGAK
eukprot:6139003-Prorocentrum_lima.AAC.1